MKKHEVTEEKTEESPENEKVLDLIRMGIIPVRGCKLYTAIDGEEEFSITSNKASRRVEMYYTHMGLIIFKKDQLKRDETILVPPPTVAYLRVKKPE